MSLCPPSSFNDYLPVLERVFSGGVDPYVHGTGFDAYRFITGYNGPPGGINPLWTPGNPARGAVSGNYRLFTADQRSSALKEVFGHTGDGAVPDGSFELHFNVCGQTLNHSLIKDAEYQKLFRDPDDHTFSQCVDYYLATGGHGRKFDTHSWLTVADEAHGVSGFVHAWQQSNGAIKSTNILPYTGG
jgi:hypothetical protein